MNVQTNKIHEQFSEAIYFWKLDVLYADLSVIKGKSLSKTEKLHLRGLLCGYSPTEIAEKLSKNVRGVESDLCSTIYHYVKVLVNKEQQKVENWRNIVEWLEKAGYKIPIEPETSEIHQKKGSEIPIDALSGLIRINQTNHNTKQGVIFEINVRIIATMPTDGKTNLPDNEK
jgi:hypothetical protein